MSKKKSNNESIDIDEIIERKLLVEFNRKPLEKSSLFGFVLACNDDFSLVQEFDRDSFVLDGYCIFRNKSVKKYSVYDDENYFLNEVISLKKIEPKPVENISIESWLEVLRSVGENFSLIMIEREKIDNEACNIGKLQKIKKKSFVLEEIDSCAEWSGAYEYKFKDLTKVGFDGFYENTLSFVEENRDKLKPKEVSD
jgi:hypothetical protein